MFEGPLPFSLSYKPEPYRSYSHRISVNERGICATLTLLNRLRGKFVVLKTASSEEIGGRVIKASNGIVVLRTLLGTKVFVPLNKIIAVITK
ncbi:hypothetical protein SAMN05518855_1014106 [Paenibacillus sp. CF384]|nr:hypothetical protein SAMN05518855_1014106 [Paenibacillus sp. CF384]